MFDAIIGEVFKELKISLSQKYFSLLQPQVANREAISIFLLSNDMRSLRAC